ncbi:MAG TPA: hypothetical protein VGG29_03920 [Caulobacteraceae bacterium]|jgi:hypothetical protein
MLKKILPALALALAIGGVALAANVLNYTAPGGSAWHVGGQLVYDAGGSMSADKGAATANSAGSYAVTINKMAGVVTTDSLSTAAGASQAITITDSQVTASSLVLVSRVGGTDTAGTPILKAVPGAGTITLTVANNHASAAFNGTFVVDFLVG